LREQAGQASVLTISDSIQAVIAARIDRCHLISGASCKPRR
jgi:hypothetical protein